MLQTPFTWTEANIGLLQSLIREGLSAGQVAAKLNISRCAVIGKARRLDLQLAGSKGRYPAHRQAPAQKVAWTEELIETASQLWTEGKSGREIAAAIGCTENAFVSLTDRYRNRFPHRKHHKRTQQTWTGRNAVKAKAPKPAEPVFPPKSFTADSVPFLLPEFPGVRFEDMEPHHCKFPVSNDHGADMLVCGAPRLKGSYCGVHHVVSRGRGTESERKATSVGRTW